MTDEQKQILRYVQTRDVEGLKIFIDHEPESLDHVSPLLGFEIFFLLEDIPSMFACLGKVTGL